MGIFSLSLRYLLGRRIALVALLSIAVGVLAMIVVVALMDGVEDFLRGHFRGTQADLAIRHFERDNLARDHAETVTRMLAREMASEGGPILALAPRKEIHALLAPGERPGPDSEDAIRGIRLLGVDFELERRVVPYDRMMDDVAREDLRVPKDERENPLAPRGIPSILLGDSLAEALGVSRSAAAAGLDRVTLITGKPAKGTDGSPRFERARCTVFRVAGCFTSGREDFDGLHALIDRRELIALVAERPELEVDSSQLHAKLVDPSRAEEVARSLSERHPELGVWTWEAGNRGELLALRDQKRIMVVILSFIIGVAAVAILGIVYLMVVEKTRDIGILRSLGLERWRMVAVFTIYGVVLGVLGCVLGVVLGIQAARHLDAIVAFLSDLFGVQLLDARVYKFKSVPTRIEAKAVVSIVAAAIGMSFFASVVPSLRAAVLAPVRCLKSE